MTPTITDTGIRRSLQIKNRWNPSRPFYVPALARAFRPDFSFSEQNSEDALKARREKKKKNNIIDDDSSSSSEGVTFESEIGQRRYQFCLKTIGQEVRRENPELVELVVTSLLRATECDVARTLHRAQQYFDFYVDVFGKLSFKQTLKDDWQLRKSFESGVLQVLENCDDKGRSAIILLFNRMLPGQTESSGMQIIRMINYIVLRTLKNYPTTQKHGFIVIPDMGGFSFENYSFSNARTNLYVISKFLPIKIHKFCLLRPLYFIKFVLPALKSFVFPGPMSANVHILTQDPRDLLREPINLRAEILPPMYGGTNTSYDFIPRLRGWELEEEETEFSEMGSSCGNDGRVDDSKIGDDKESGFARELFKRQDQFGNDIAMDATRAPSRGSNDLDDDDFSNNDDKTSNNSDMTMTSRDDNNTYDSADDKKFY
ncbi:unnamed protein product [Bathycoccus prasinos]